MDKKEEREKKNRSIHDLFTFSIILFLFFCRREGGGRWASSSCTWKNNIFLHKGITYITIKKVHFHHATNSAFFSKHNLATCDFNIHLIPKKSSRTCLLPQTARWRLITQKGGKKLVIQQLADKISHQMALFMQVINNLFPKSTRRRHIYSVWKVLILDEKKSNSQSESKSLSRVAPEWD